MTPCILVYGYPCLDGTYIFVDLSLCNDYTEWNVWMIMNVELERMWKELTLV
jgi:hypothetical protein